MNQVKAGPLSLTASQAAQALGVSIGTVRRWSDLGHLRSYRTPGGQRRFSQAQIRAFIDSLQAEADAIEAAEHSPPTQAPEHSDVREAAEHSDAAERTSA